MPYKHEFIRMVRDFALGHLEEARAECRAVITAVSQYEEAGTLGGPELSRLILAFGPLKARLSLRKLPHDIEGTAWSYATF